ncbi:MAG: DNA polymerase IV [Mucilaginibacter sp.]|uniref:DNA polymerase Y family protein n=1 Tax=Mucilaginibacter sp. TaxID=1882438 RepID=UPI0034E540DA
MNLNSIKVQTEPRVLFVDMNSFFARCEQQDNYWLRGRPVAVCVYTGKFGFAIALSVEAKRMGVKTGMRLNEAMKICPELIPLESNPNRYRQYHTKIINVLKHYCPEVIPKSIDEAIVNLTNYQMVYPDTVFIAQKIKEDIKREVGDWLTCSIGIAPNAFLAKLGSDMGGFDGLQIITAQNIDDKLGALKLSDLPGIGKNMVYRLERAGIATPLQMRYTPPERLKAVFKSIEGLYWHYKLNFVETGMSVSDYKGMQAMRQISADKRSNPEYIEQLFLTLCSTLERRMVHHNFYCKNIAFTVKYVDDSRWDDGFSISIPIQDAISLMRMIKKRIARFEETTQSAPIFNDQISGLRVMVTDFVNTGKMMYSLFEDVNQGEKARKTMYAIQQKFGADKLKRAVEVTDGKVVADVIGFGCVKDLSELDYLASASEN